MQASSTRRQALAAALGLLPLLARAQPRRILRVGPTRPLRSLAQAAAEVRSGDRVEVDAGDYPGDVARWQVDGLQLVAVGGRVRVPAAGRSEGDKGIFVVAGEDVRIEGFDFSEARVPDRNGAGIRFERGSLRVRDCSFRHCENGLLSGNEASARLDLEDCEFAQAPEGVPLPHLLYVGRIATLRVSGCLFSQGCDGHLLKSRAARNEIVCNRFGTGGEDRAAYELDFPEGGDILVLGNLIEQSLRSSNRLMCSVGEEGLRAGPHSLALAHNTWINHLPWPGALLRVAQREVDPVRVSAYNNLLVGPGHLGLSPDWPQGGNVDLGLRTDALDARGYPLEPDRARGVAAEALPAALRLRQQYRGRGRVLPLSSPARLAGAVQAL